jgi:hypothetical protein
LATTKLRDQPKRRIVDENVYQPVGHGAKSFAFRFGWQVFYYALFYRFFQDARLAYLLRVSDTQSAKDAKGRRQ